jgi:hypothetical protein
MDEHPTNAPRGIAYGLMLSIILWITILFVVGFFA